MAIFADYRKTTYTQSETETYQEKVTYPSDLPDFHSKYEFRGQTVTETFPVINEESTLYKNAYIVISHYNFYKFVVNEDGEHLFDIQFLIYQSKDDYLNDKESYIFEDDAIGELRLIQSSDDLRIKGYKILKNLPHITNTIDD